MEQFHSGPWTGFYTYNAVPDRGRMDLDLTFKEGIITGSGNDPVGPFTIRGRYDEQTDEVWWHKSYLGRHDVFYQGFREMRFIWGTWEINPGWRGGFKIWPKGMGESTEAEVEEQTPVDAVAPELSSPEKVLFPAGDSTLPKPRSNLLAKAGCP